MIFVGLFGFLVVGFFGRGGVGMCVFCLFWGCWVFLVILFVSFFWRGLCCSFFIGGLVYVVEFTVSELYLLYFWYF